MWSISPRWKAASFPLVSTGTFLLSNREVFSNKSTVPISSRSKIHGPCLTVDLIFTVTYDYMIFRNLCDNTVADMCLLQLSEPLQGQPVLSRIVPLQWKSGTYHAVPCVVVASTYNQMSNKQKKRETQRHRDKSHHCGWLVVFILGERGALTHLRTEVSSSKPQFLIVLTWTAQ